MQITTLPSSAGSAATRVAVIGGGMAGLAAGRECRKLGYHVTLFEAHHGTGMDAHTLCVDGGHVDVPLRVMSPLAWQSVLSLAAEAGIGTFSVDTFVSCSWENQQTWFRSGRMPVTGWPMAGSWRYLNTTAWRMASGLVRLSRLSQRLSRTGSTLTLAECLQQESFDPLFWRGLVLPLLTTICTCDEQHLLNWPAAQLLPLLDTILHRAGLLRMQGGTSALASGLAQDMQCVTGSPVIRVVEQGEQVLVKNARGDSALYDRVIIATQANQLDFLADERQVAERKILQSVRFDDGELIVHRDTRFMPRHRRDWTALNFQMDAALQRAMFTVWVNAVEPTLKHQAPVFQTWNPLFEPAADTVLARVPLQRAVVHSETATIHRQLDEWHRMPGRRIFYCGSWAGEGVPLLESAVRSARNVATILQEQAV